MNGPPSAAMGPLGIPHGGVGGMPNSAGGAVPPPGSAGGSSAVGGAVSFPHTPGAFPDEFDPALVPPELKKEVSIDTISPILANLYNLYIYSLSKKRVPIGL